MSLWLWLTIELSLVAFFVFGWFLWHRRQKGGKAE
jgi:uncharacterized protein YneF (UPF0154 family)